MKLINNIFLQQQTSTTLFVFTMVVVFVFLLIILIIGSKGDEKKVNIKNGKSGGLSFKELTDEELDKEIEADKKKYQELTDEELSKEIEADKKKIEATCSFVEKNYDRSKNLISIEPKDYGIYNEIIDPIEKTKMLVIEYVHNLRKKQRNYKFEWDYQGLIEGLCVYKISKTSKYNENENFSIDDIDSALLEHKFIVEKPFTDKKLKILVAPYLVPIDNLGFNRPLNEVETNEVVKKFCRKGKFGFIKDRIENIEKNSKKYHRYFLAYNDDLNKKRSRKISQKVKDEVWNRDNGKCVECGSNEDLEFDHIIPHSKGGANTYRNIQLLCEPCNRSKSAKIG